MESIRSNLGAIAIDPSHKVCQEGKGSADGRTEGRTGPLPVHFRFTGWTQDGLPKICGHTDRHTYIRTDGKKVTPKDPLRINARDLKSFHSN